MTDVLSYIGALFSGVWKFFGIEYPGTGLTVAVISFGALVVVLSLKVLSIIFGINTASPGDFQALKGGNNKHIKVSEARKNDTH